MKVEPKGKRLTEYEYGKTFCDDSIKILNVG